MKNVYEALEQRVKERLKLYGDIIANTSDDDMREEARIYYAAYSHVLSMIRNQENQP